MRNAREHKLFMLVWQFLPPRDLRFQRWFGLDVPLDVKNWSVPSLITRLCNYAGYSPSFEEARKAIY